MKSEKKSVLENNFCTVAEGEIFAKRKQIFFSGGRSRLVSTGVSTNQEPPFRLLRPETPAVAEGERNGVAKRHLPSSFSLFPQIFLLSRPLPPPPFSFFSTLPFLLSSFLFLSFLPLLLFPPSPPFPPFLASFPPSLLFSLFFFFPRRPVFYLFMIGFMKNEQKQKKPELELLVSRRRRQLLTTRRCTPAAGALFEAESTPGRRARRRSRLQWRPPSSSFRACHRLA